MIYLYYTDIHLLRKKDMLLAKAIFAAGCFWGVQAAFDAVPGVVSSQVGYTGGSYDKPSYQQVSTGNTGHAEAIEVTYNPQIVSYEDLLDVFFKNHNPTTLNRQGPDVGTQYRSVIFYEDEAQKIAAEQKIRDLSKSKYFARPIVTQLQPASTFYPAEDYHQQYLKKRGQTSCSLGSK